MNRSSTRKITAGAALLLATGLMVGMWGARTARAQAAAGQGTIAPGPLAEEKFKNIQALKGVPADDVVPAMQFISNSLGVECEFCHVRNAFDKDDIDKKKIARKMITMTMAINKDSFDSKRQVTCFSCHRGAHDPVGVPIIPDVEPQPEHDAGNAGGTPPAATGPTADQILDKWAQAVGGADALHKITSRVEKGTIKFGEGQSSVEIYAKAPGKRLSVMHTPRGESLTGFDGQAGWLTGFGPPRDMTGGDIDVARIDSDMYLPVEAKKVFTQFRVRPPEKVGDRDAYLVFGLRQGHPPVRLYFDEQSGLLVRMVQYVETPLGRNPVQIDFADYRDADGVKVPFQWTLARPRGRFTIQVNEIQQNVPIDDAKFAKPAGPPPPPPPK